MHSNSKQRPDAARMIRSGLDHTLADQDATRAALDRARGCVALLRAQLDTANAELARLRRVEPANDAHGARAAA